jgi:hypothetical protein
MADFTQTGLGDWYSELLGAAQQQLVRQPDGSYAPAPQFGGPTSLDAIYGGILPSGPTTRQVSTTPVIRSPRDPVGYGADWNNLNGMVAGAWGGAPPPVQTAGARPAITEGVQPAGTVQMPPGARPSNIPPPSPPASPVQSAAWDPFNTINPNADQSRLPPNDGGEAGFMAAFYPNAQNPAIGAIDQATGVPMPRPRPDVVMPLTPSPLLRAPAIPAPRNSAGGNFTVKRGDTVWDLARKNNTTVNAIALANGLRDPSKIRAGQQLTIPSVPMPRTPPPSVRASKTAVNADEFLERYR